jgi:hypothetical protein
MKIHPVTLKWPHALIGLIGACTLDFFTRAPQVQPKVQHAVVEVTLLAIGLGLSILAGYLLQKKNKSLVQDDKPTTLATRGSFIPLVKGRRRIGFVFGYAGNRHTRKEKAQGGGKGSAFGGPKVDVFLEDGWHLLAVGPLFALHEIEQNGTPIFTGPITSISHPSGSLIDLGSEGSFRIFWGEIGQPVNTYLGDSSRVGISSRWPQCAYIEWRNKRLGQSPAWPTLTYTVESRPQTAHLSLSDGYIPETFILDPTVEFPITGRLNGAPGTGYFQVAGTLLDQFKPGGKILVQGNVGLGVDTDYTIRSVSVVDIGSGMGFPPVVTNVTRIFCNETITGADISGHVERYVGQRDDGWNAAHLLAELLFDPWPIGLGLDSSEWDMDTLEAFGELTAPDEENLRCSAIAPDGQDVRGLLGALMQDFGVMLPLDMTTGKIRFEPVRKPTGSIPNIPAAAILQFPEIESLLADRPVDRIVFSFSDETNVYRDVTIAIDEDGQATRAEFYRARQVQIVATTHFDTAARIAERRSFEELAGGAVIRLHIGRSARTLIPGRALVASGFDEVLRVTSTHHDPLSGQVDVTLTTDFYGAPLSDFVVDRGVTAGTGNQVQQDLAVKIVELPEILTGAGGPQTAMVLAIRAHAAIRGHNQHISADNVTYTFFGEDLTIVTGGTLIDPLTTSSPMEISQGPTFTVLGPDISSALDLSSDATSWRGGRQLAVFVHATSRAVMIAYVQKVTAISGTTYRLDGLILNRYDTRALDLPAGSQVFILQNDDGLGIQDPLVQPNTAIYAKAEPLGIGTIPLSQIAPEAVVLYGKGVRPVPVSGIRLNAGSDTVGPGTAGWTDHSYLAAGASPADDLILRWAYSTPQTPGSGAGIFGWGSLVGDAAPEGDFFVEILNSSDVVLRTDSVLLPSYTYLRADRLVDFGGEPTSFKLRVTQRRGGFSASTVTQTITRTT